MVDACIVLQREGQLVAIEATDEVADDVVFKSELQGKRAALVERIDGTVDMFPPAMPVADADDDGCRDGNASCMRGLPVPVRHRVTWTSPERPTVWLTVRRAVEPPCRPQ